jgi:hypothetical protein
MTIAAVDGGDTCVIKRRQELCLALKASKATRIRRKPVGKDLQRDLSPERGVGGPIDLSHTTDAELRDDGVGAKAGAGSQRQ